MIVKAHFKLCFLLCLLFILIHDKIKMICEVIMMNNKIIEFIKSIIIIMLYALFSTLLLYKRFEIKSMIILIFSFSIFYFLSIFLNRRNIDDYFIRHNLFNINKFFVIYASILGLSMSFLIPFHNVPDEIDHINLMYSERNLDDTYESVFGKFDASMDTTINENNIVNQKDYFDNSKKVNVKNSFKLPKITAIKHFPQIIGSIIGEIFHVPYYIYLSLMEICGLIFYILVCNKALKKMPFKKETLMCIMLLPVCLQQMSSISYDTMLTATCFLFIASVFELKYKEDNIVLKDLMILLFYLLLIAICKLPYVLLGLLIFMLPLSKTKFRLFNLDINGESLKKYILNNKSKLIAVLIVFVLIFSIFGYFTLNKMTSGRVLISTILNPIDTLKIFYYTLKNEFSFYVDTIFGNLGVFNIFTYKFIDAFLLGNLLIISLFSFKIENSKKIVNEFKLCKFDKTILLITFISVGYLILLSMFEWTLYLMNISYENFSIQEFSAYLKSVHLISGVQGRYFIPILPLILIPLGNKKVYEKTLRFNPIAFQTFYYIFLFCYMILLMLFRFWI